MSKISRVRRKQERDKAKAARKAANYLRCGPKAGSGNKSKARRVVGSDGPPSPKAPRPTTSAKGRFRRRRTGLNMMVRK